MKQHSSSLVAVCALCGLSWMWRMRKSSHTSPQTAPLFSFGVVADIQFADTEVGYNYARTMKRDYRGALRMLKKACDFWNMASVNFVVNLGDIIDGQNKGRNKSESALDAVLKEFGRCKCKLVYHLVGNHELYNFGRDDLNKRLHTARGADGQEFYAFSPVTGWKFLVLDSYQEAVIGWPEGGYKWERARKLLERNNKNIRPDSLGGGDWMKGLAGPARRFVPFNGGLGEVQLSWLRQELQAAAQQQEQVVVLSHVILHPEACDGVTMVWDYSEALEILAEFDCVAAVLCGHDHKGGYHKDAQGVHHVTLKSPLNRGDEGSSFGIVNVHEGFLELTSPLLLDLVDEEALSSNKFVGDSTLRLEIGEKLSQSQQPEPVRSKANVMPAL